MLGFALLVVGCDPSEPSSSTTFAPATTSSTAGSADLSDIDLDPDEGTEVMSLIDRGLLAVGQTYETAGGAVGYPEDLPELLLELERIKEGWAVLAISGNPALRDLYRMEVDGYLLVLDAVLEHTQGNPRGGLDSVQDWFDGREMIATADSELFPIVVEYRGLFG